MMVYLYKINLLLPNKVTSLKPFSDKYLISSSIDSTGLERSRPLVKGTMQYVHMLSQPRIIDLKIIFFLIYYLLYIVIYKKKIIVI